MIHWFDNYLTQMVVCRKSLTCCHSIILAINSEIILVKILPSFAHFAASVWAFLFFSKPPLLFQLSNTAELWHVMSRCAAVKNRASSGGRGSLWWQAASVKTPYRLYQLFFMPTSMQLYRNNLKVSPTC